MGNYRGRTISVRIDDAVPYDMIAVSAEVMGAESCDPQKTLSFSRVRVVGENIQ